VFYKIVLGLSLLTLGLFASEGTETDILPRTINFLIFAGILYYLIGDKLKAFFDSRSNSIAEDLDEVQKVLKESKDKKEAAVAKLREAEKIAEDIILMANKDSKVVTEKMQQSVKKDLANLDKQQLELMELEKKKVQNEVAREVLEELLSDGSLSLTNQHIIDIIKKKVA
jgi:F-type H+-transporting ATPase subunit b